MNRELFQQKEKRRGLASLHILMVTTAFASMLILMVNREINQNAVVIGGQDDRLNYAIAKQIENLLNLAIQQFAGIQAIRDNNVQDFETLVDTALASVVLPNGEQVVRDESMGSFSDPPKLAFYGEGNPSTDNEKYTSSEVPLNEITPFIRKTDGSGEYEYFAVNSSVNKELTHDFYFKRVRIEDEEEIDLATITCTVEYFAVPITYCSRALVYRNGEGEDPLDKVPELDSGGYPTYLNNTDSISCLITTAFKTIAEGGDIISDLASEGQASFHRHSVDITSNAVDYMVNGDAYMNSLINEAGVGAEEFDFSVSDIEQEIIDNFDPIYGVGVFVWNSALKYLTININGVIAAGRSLIHIKNSTSDNYRVVLNEDGSGTNNSPIIIILDGDSGDGEGFELRCTSGQSPGSLRRSSLILAQNSTIFFTNLTTGISGNFFLDSNSTIEDDTFYVPVSDSQKVIYGSLALHQDELGNYKGRSDDHPMPVLEDSVNNREDDIVPRVLLTRITSTIGPPS